MKKALCLITLMYAISCVLSQTPSIPFGSNSGYSYGSLPSGNSDVTSKEWYDYWLKSFYKDCGSFALIVNDYGGSNSYSEGQGYGMLMTAYSGDKPRFDKLMAGYFANTNSNGLMNWTVSCTNKSVGQNGATDGDLDAAMAILIANKQWPSSDYATKATTLINSIKSKEFVECSGKWVQKAGDFLGGCNCTNPSYYATGYYRAFAKHVTTDAAFWIKAADDGLDLLLKATHPTTGLNPAWTDQSGSITTGGTGDCNNILAPGGGSRTDYQFDAARTPWRIVVDYLWWGTPKARQYLEKITTWALSKGIGNIYAGHKLDGTAYLTYSNSSFVGAFAIGAMGTTNTTAINNFHQYWISNSMADRNYASGKKLDDQPYFQNSLRSIYYMVASGNFWNPYATGSVDNNCNIAAPSTMPVTYCLNTTATALTASGTALKWYTAATGGSSLANAPTPSTAASGSTTYYVTQTSGNCESPRSSLVVTVSNQPAAPSANTLVTYTVGAQASALTATGTDLKWYTVVTGGTPSTTAPIPNTATTGTQNYYVSQSTGTCESPRTQIVVTINTAASTSPPTVTTPVTYCLGASATPLTANGTNLLWYTSASGGSGSNVAPIPNTSTAGSVNYYVSQMVSGVESQRSLITVNVSQLLPSPTVSATISYLQNSIASTLTANGTNLKWYTSASGGSGSTAAIVPSTTTVGTTIYYVSQSQGSCESPRASITVIITAPKVSDALNIYKITSPIVIDGVKESIWSNNSILNFDPSKLIAGSVTGSSDLSGIFRVVWDNTNMYIFGEITDDTKINDSPEMYNDDAVEIYFDVNNDKSFTYDGNDAQFTFGWNDGGSISVNPSSKSASGINYMIVSNTTGYTFEAQIPWSTLGTSVSADKMIGFDIQLNDDDNGGERDGKLSLVAPTDDAWLNPSLIGTVMLKDAVVSYEDYLFGKISIFPNPAQNMVYLAGINESFGYEIININGKKLQSGISSGELNIEDLKNGIYGLVIKIDGYQKLVKISKAE